MSKKNDEKEEFSGEKSKVTEYTITCMRHMEKRLRNLETEKQLLDAERLRLEQDLHSLRNEIDRLREPPLLGGIVIAVKDDDRYAVRSSTGTFYVVNVSRRAKQKKLEPGTFVLLNQRTFAIMDTIDIDLDTYRKISRVIYTGENLLEQITKNQTILMKYIKKVDKLEDKVEVLNNKLSTLKE